MAQIPLILCIVFIIFLFVQDKKKKSKTSWEIWIPFLWLLIAGSRSISLWLNPELLLGLSDESLDNSPIDRNFYIFIIISILFILFKRKLSWSLLIRNNIWFFLFFLYCGISIIWSDVLIVSINTWIKLMLLPLIALVILTEQNPIESLKTILRRLSFILIPLSILLIKFYPLYGRTYSRWTGEPMYGGVTIHKNSLGIVCVVTGIFLMWDLISMLRNDAIRIGKVQLLINIALIGMIFWLLLKCDSATSLCVLIISVCVLIILEFPVIKSNIKSINIFVFFLLFLALSFFWLLNAFDDFVSSLGRDMTLTGRTVIWAKVLSMVKDPIFGTGYASFWHGERGEFLLDLNWQKLTQAHNGYIQVYLDLGLVGLILLILMIIKTYKNAKSTLLSDFNYGKFQITFLVAILLSNITEATFATKGLFSFMFVLISLKNAVSEERPIQNVNTV